ncbi:MAG: DUF393 domain-containing protein [Bacteroidales bacterium]|nr:DUF393 domain-containing protein [Bacteroidales bacterium]
MENRPDHLILFDPYCNLCTAIVKYILKQDKKERFYFGSLYSKRGKDIKKHLSWEKQKNTIIYFEKDEVFTQSDAAIRIISKLRGIHKTVSVFRYVPKSFRDYLYKIVAKYRYNIFGKRKDPFKPSEIHKSRFIDYSELI